VLVEDPRHLSLDRVSETGSDLLPHGRLMPEERRE
jgi:hypothetical protein